MFLFHLSSLASSSILLLWFCLSVSMGALDMEGDARPSALGRLGHTTSLKRGGSLRIPRSNSECHCHTHFLCFRGGFPFHTSLCFYLFMYTLNATYCTSGKHDHCDYSSSSRKLNIFYCSRWNERHLLFYVSCGLQIETSRVCVLQHGAMKHHSKCSLWRSCRMWSLVSCPISGNFGYLMLMAAFLVR